MATARSVEQTLSRYKALTAAATATATVLQYQLDEETGIRGYAATANRKLLTPYLATRPRVARAFARLRAELLAGNADDALPSVDRLAAINAQWEAEVAKPALAAHGPRKAASLELRGKELIDQYRSVSQSLDDRLVITLGRLSQELTDRFRAIAVVSSILVALAAVIIIAFASLRAATQAHLARAAHLRALIEAIPHIVWMSGVDGKITFANERWYDYTGKSPNGGIDAQWIAAIHPADVIESTRAWAHSLRTGAPFEAQYRLAGADGSYRWFVVRGVPERNKRGTIIQWFGTCTDVDAQHSQLENTQRVADTFARAQLPMTLPSSPYVRFDATYLAAEDLLQIGGDWYDVFALDERRFVFSLGDVTGHGLDAAIVMTRIRQTIIALASVESDPAFILEKANAALRLQGDCMVTALCGILDAQSGELVYASAGHPPSLIRHDGGAIDELTSSAPPLGVMDALQVARRHVQMAPGDMLVCYTDGIIENERDLTIGEARLRAVLAKLQTFDRAQAAGVIRERILGGRRGRDDVAILVIDRSGPAYVAERPKAVLTGDPHE